MSSDCRPLRSLFFSDFSGRRGKSAQRSPNSKLDLETDLLITVNGQMIKRTLYHSTDEVKVKFSAKFKIYCNIFLKNVFLNFQLKGFHRFKTCSFYLSVYAVSLSYLQ